MRTRSPELDSSRASGYNKVAKLSSKNANLNFTDSFAMHFRVPDLDMVLKYGTYVCNIFKCLCYALYFFIYRLITKKVDSIYLGLLISNA